MSRLSFVVLIAKRFSALAEAHNVLFHTLPHTHVSQVRLANAIGYSYFDPILGITNFSSDPLLARLDRTELILRLQL